MTDPPGPRGCVALTFDDGPNDNTATLLATLTLAGVRATLFNTGENAVARPALVRAEAEAGMWIGNHTFTHPHMLELDDAGMDDELARTQRAIEAAGAETPVLFRPPYGETDERLEAAARALGLAVTMWGVDTRDWAGASTDEIVAAAEALRDGDVILMHDWPPPTIAAIPRIVSRLHERGLAAGQIDPRTGRAVAPR